MQHAAAPALWPACARKPPQAEFLDICNSMACHILTNFLHDIAGILGVGMATYYQQALASIPLVTVVTGADASEHIH